MKPLKTLILGIITLINCASSITTAQKNESIALSIVEILKDLPHIQNFNDITYQISYGLKSLNISDIEVNINFIKAENNNNNTNSGKFDNSLKYLFENIIKADWAMKDILKEIALFSHNATVYEVLYQILWEELKINDKKNNPFSYIELYTDIDGILANHTTSARLQQLQRNIEKDLIECSANLLQSYFIHNSTVKRLLYELKNINNLYHMTIPVIFEKIKSIEKYSLISDDLLNFDATTSEAVYNHINFIEFLNSSNEIVPNRIYTNLEYLIAQTDFTNISAIERKKSVKFLPLSMSNIFTVESICLKNMTTNFYLYECPQTYLMCTNLIANNTNHLNRKKATFKIERVGGNAYTLYSQYWSRYLRLQSNNSKNILLTAISHNTTTNSSKITKNLYSNAESSSWLISFHGIYASLQDAKEKSYVCGGNPSYWSNSENYAYTRKVNDLIGNENECLWLIEDCSKMD